MASDDKRQSDEALEVLTRAADAEGELNDADRAALESMAADVETPGLQDDILARYADYGRDLLSDTMPQSLDPRMIASLRPILGDVSHVRVHRGKLASEAAQVMGARAFAIGDQDIFLDGSEFDMTSDAGRSLVAHEVAHTVDASTGFAMSSRGGSSDVSDRERFAEETQARYEANEQQKRASKGDGGAADPTLAAKSPKVPQRKLARMVVDVLMKQGVKGNDRTGGSFGR